MKWVTRGGDVRKRGCDLGATLAGVIVNELAIRAMAVMPMYKKLAY